MLGQVLSISVRPYSYPWHMASQPKFLRYDLGQCRRGDVIEVTLTHGANVRLLDSTNFSKYRRGQPHRYHGGLAKRSPVTLAVPRSGHWYVAVDMQGLRGSTRASVRKVAADALKPLPPIREARSDLAEIAEAGKGPGRSGLRCVHFARERRQRRNRETSCNQPQQQRA